MAPDAANEVATKSKGATTSSTNITFLVIVNIMPPF
jgi:hypothetical protein